MDKPRTRRLRKKLKLGEFREDGFEVDITMRIREPFTLDEALDEWLGFVDSNCYVFGGGAAEDKLAGFLTSNSNRSLTEDDRILVEQWLSKREWVSNFEIGKLKDAWHE